MSAIVTMNRTDEKVFPFTLTDEQGRTISLAEFEGSWLLIIFLRHRS
jgi:peroxiredoxin